MMINKSVPIRMAEVVGALSLATDLGMGQPLEFALESCILSLRLGDAMGFSDTALREVYYQSLLRYIGCNVETHMLAMLVGDEIALRNDFAQIDNGSTFEIAQLFARFIRQAHPGEASLEGLRTLASGMLRLPQIKASFAGHCEVAQRLAERLGFDGNVVYALGQLYERWDGKGSPKGLKGEAIAPAVRVVSLAQDALVFARLGGEKAASDMVRKRRGSAYSPQASDVFCQQAGSLLLGLDQESVWESVMALEPGEPILLDDEAFDRACAAMADFVDLKSSFTLGHSSAVATLAARAVQAAGLPESDVRLAHRAGLLHNLGRTGVSSGIWEKTGSFSRRDWDLVRLVPYYTERVLARPQALNHPGQLAGVIQERIDGSGYHRGLKGGALSPVAQLLSAADVFQALGESRPYRPAFSPGQSANELRGLAKQGKLDRDSVEWVLAAAGMKTKFGTMSLASGLSEREVQVLRLLARGQTIREIATQLVIAPKTADHHIQNIYAKIGVSTRAGATLFAVEHHLLGD